MVLKRMNPRWVQTVAREYISPGGGGRQEKGGGEGEGQGEGSVLRFYVCLGRLQLRIQI